MNFIKKYKFSTSLPEVNTSLPETSTSLKETITLSAGIAISAEPDGIMTETTSFNSNATTTNFEEYNYDKLVPFPGARHQ
jgi:hypothetical protein